MMGKESKWISLKIREEGRERGIIRPNDKEIKKKLRNKK